MSTPSPRTGPIDSTNAALDPALVPDLGTLYGQHADAVARWAARLLGPAHDIEDVVHEVFLVACRRLSEFRGDAKITTWLYQITLRIAHDRRRALRRRRWLFGKVALDESRPEAPAGDEAARIPTDQPGPLELLERKEASTQLYAILDGMSEKYRTTIILFELEGLSGQEIATITKTSISNVWIRLFRGRQQFLKCLLALEAKEAR